MVTALWQPIKLIVSPIKICWTEFTLSLSDFSCTTLFPFWVDASLEVVIYWAWILLEEGSLISCKTLTAQDKSHVGSFSVSGCLYCSFCLAVLLITTGCDKRPVAKCFCCFYYETSVRAACKCQWAAGQHTVLRFSGWSLLHHEIWSCTLLIPARNLLRWIPRLWHNLCS